MDKKIYLLAVKMPILKWRRSVYEFSTEAERNKMIDELKGFKISAAKAEWSTADIYEDILLTGKKPKKQNG